MELFEQDFYRIEKPKDTYIEFAELFETYLPLIGTNALALFGVLWSESKNLDENKHIRLCKLTNLDIDEIENARCQLEKYGLLKTFYSEKNETYLYRLQTPLYGAKFLDHYVYGLKYKNVLGLSDYEISRTNIIPTSFSANGYKEITTKLDKEEVLSISENDVKEFIDSRIENIKEDDSFGFSSLFDYQDFIRGLTDLTFPKEYRTSENLRFIGGLSTLTDISSQKLRELVCQSIDIKKGYFNKELLLKKVVKETKVILDENIGYNTSPLNFLQNKQNGVSVSPASESILQYLANDTKFPSNIINIIVEFVLDTNDNKLPRNYTMQVAETFARSNVKTEQEALELVKKLKKENKKEAIRYQSITKVKPNPYKEDKSDPKEVEALQKELLEMFEK